VLLLKATFAALMLEAACKVCPPPNSRVVPARAVKLPELVPPPVKASVPLFTFTAFVLLNAALTVVVPVPALLVKVPALLNCGVAPPMLKAKLPSKFVSKLAPA
jgi:hypothetical protein